MLKTLEIFGFFIICLLLTSCYRNEIRTVSIPVGNLAGQPCFDAIQSSINRELKPNAADGRIKSIKADFDNDAVLVTFNARHMAIKNIEHAIAKAGFSTYDQQGKVSIAAQANAPEGCGKP